MKQEAFIDRDSSTNLIDEAKTNRAKFLRHMLSSFNSKNARPVTWIGLTAFVVISLVAWSSH